MNVFLIIVCVLMVGLMLALIKVLVSIKNGLNEKHEGFSDTTIQRMESLRLEGEELREHARRVAEQQKVYHPRIPDANPILGWTGGDDRIHTTNPEGKNILIPEHLSEEEKEILRQFYNL